MFKNEVFEEVKKINMKGPRCVTSFSHISRVLLYKSGCLGDFYLGIVLASI